MRRLPIYFLIDISESMVGEPIQQVEEGLATIIQALKTDPNAIETVWISIIVFAGQAKTLVPLQEIISFYPPKFPIGSGTSLSNGLGHLMYDLRKNIVKTTAEQKGDWKPIVFLFTDGQPNTADSWQQEYKALQETRGCKPGLFVAIGAGKEANEVMLRQIAPQQTYMLADLDAAKIRAMFEWIAESTVIASKTLGLPGQTRGQLLPPAPPNLFALPP